ncbi:MAG: ABC transporter substrate-binding protein [Actinomycetota bacterium]
MSRHRTRLLRLALAVGLLGVSCGGGSGAADEGSVPVKVGLLYTLSGFGGDLAQAALGSAALAATDGNGRGYEIEIVDADYGGKPKRAAGVAERLADQGVAGIVVASDDPALVDALSEFDRVPLLYALIADDEAVSTDSASFRVAPSNSLQAETLAGFMVDDRGYKRVVVVNDDTDFGRAGGDAIEQRLESEGARVVLREEFERGGDVSTLTTTAGQKRAEALVIWTEDTGESARITIEAHTTRQSYQVVLSGNQATFRFGKNASSQVVPTAFVEGILSVGTWSGPWFDLPRMRGFYERFQEENDALAPVQAVQIYDAVLLIGEAARRADGATAGAVVDGLESIENFEGAGVPLSFSPTDHEAIDTEDMAILAFTKNPDSAGGDLAPDVSTGGGFFTIDTITAELPPELSYLLEGLPE